MIKLIKDFLEYRKRKENQRYCCKRFVVGQAMIKYFTDLQISTGKVDLPPFILAHNAMKELRTKADVDKIYRKLSIAGLV